MAIVYRHIRKDKNEPFYIGIGETEKRAYEKRARNSFWRKVASKTQYTIEILFDDLTWEEACEKEKEFISLYGRKDLNTGILVNLTNGGDGTWGIIPWNKGKHHTEEQIEKLKISHKGMTGKKHSTETILKMRQSSLGKKGTRLGMKSTEETKLKMRNSQLGKKMSEETKIKISNTLKQKFKQNG
jgi:hypothetical protein